MLPFDLLFPDIARIEYRALQLGVPGGPIEAELVLRELTADRNRRLTELDKRGEAQPDSTGIVALGVIIPVHGEAS